MPAIFPAAESGGAGNRQLKESCRQWRSISFLCCNFAQNLSCGTSTAHIMSWIHSQYTPSETTSKESASVHCFSYNNFFFFLFNHFIVLIHIPQHFAASDSLSSADENWGCASVSHCCRIKQVLYVAYRWDLARARAAARRKSAGITAPQV